MLIKTLELGHMGTNCYIVTDEDSLECAVIDPGDESNTVLDYLEANHLKCRLVLLTHGHFDHTGAVRQVMEETGAPLVMHAADACTGRSSNGFDFVPPENTAFCREGDVYRVGSLEFRVLETPGHTPGGVSYVCGDALFTGDTLFKDSCGRTDFPGGDVQTLLDSLAKLAALEGDYEVYPGHMDSSTLERERSFNYYMRYALDR